MNTLRYFATYHPHDSTSTKHYSERMRKRLEWIKIFFLTCFLRSSHVCSMESPKVQWVELRDLFSVYVFIFHISSCFYSRVFASCCCLAVVERFMSLRNLFSSLRKFLEWDAGVNFAAFASLGKSLTRPRKVEIVIDPFIVLRGKKRPSWMKTRKTREWVVKIFKFSLLWSSSFRIHNIPTDDSCSTSPYSIS